MKKITLRNRCPECISTNVRVSYLREKLAFPIDLFFQPYRCRNCRVRFLGIKRAFRSFLKVTSIMGTGMIIMVTAVFLLSRMPNNQVNASQNDDAIPRKIQLADQGDPVAQLNVGLMYLKGIKMKKDPNEAARWLKQAAQQGQVEAQYRLGILYEEGIGVIQDYEQGVYWVRMAAEHGMARALYQMGIIYDLGLGVPIDHIQAYVWYNLAAAGGEVGAVAHRADVARNMTRNEISEAQRLSRLWKPSAAKGTSSVE